VARGEVAELFGEDALTMDSFFRMLGTRKIAEESYALLKDEDKEVYQAYADGINDYVAGIDLMGDDPTGRLLPPEFLTFGITKETWRPWSPVDSICVLKLMNFHLSWNWMNDLTRESIKRLHPELADMAEEISPFHKGFLAKLTTVLDEEDLKAWDQYSDKTLLERYEAAQEHVKKASPKFTYTEYKGKPAQIPDGTVGKGEPVLGED